MDAKEQRAHKRVTDDLAKAIEEMSEAVSEHMAEIASDLRSSIGDERTHRLKLADEQHSYVDDRDRELRECCQARWDETNEAQRRILDNIASLHERKFFGRLKWLLFGR